MEVNCIHNTILIRFVNQELLFSELIALNLTVLWFLYVPWLTEYYITILVRKVDDSRWLTRVLYTIFCNTVREFCTLRSVKYAQNGRILVTVKSVRECVLSRTLFKDIRNLPFCIHFTVRKIPVQCCKKYDAENIMPFNFQQNRQKWNELGTRLHID